MKYGSLKAHLHEAYFLSYNIVRHLVTQLGPNLIFLSEGVVRCRTTRKSCFASTGLKSGANLTTFEFTAAAPALYAVG
jgi:hypothetical protein